MKYIKKYLIWSQIAGLLGFIILPLPSFTAYMYGIAVFGYVLSLYLMTKLVILLIKNYEKIY